MWRPVVAPAKVRNQVIKRPHVVRARSYEHEQKEGKPREDVAGEFVQRVKQQMPIGHRDEDRAQSRVRYDTRKTEAYQQARTQFEHRDRGSNRPKQPMRDPRFVELTNEEPLSVTLGRQLKTFPPADHEEDQPEHPARGIDRITGLR